MTNDHVKPTTPSADGAWWISYKTSGSRRFKQPPYFIHYTGIKVNRHGWSSDPAKADRTMTTKKAAQTVADAILIAHPRMKRERFRIDYHRA